MSSNRTFIWIGVVTVLGLCCTVAAAAVIWQIIPMFANPDSLLTSVADALETPTATPIPIIERTPVATVPPIANPAPAQTATSPAPEREPGQAKPLLLSTEELLAQAKLPERDQRMLAIRLKNNGQDIPKTAPGAGKVFNLGDSNTFWITDNQQEPPRQFRAEATLEYITDHSYWWVEKDLAFNAEGLQRSAERFENQTYPMNRAFFGSEWTPGVDNDPRVHIFMGNVPGVAGYFSASNSYSKLAEPYSNEREMFFINLKAISPGNDYFDGVLAHEFQHMIHWAQDRNEDTWVNEGLSELATFINGYGSSGFVGAFSRVPDTQLNSWSSNPNATLANYGGSFLFMAYFLQRFGEDMTKAVVANPQSGIEGFNAVLAEHGYSDRFDDIFADFVIANHLNEITAGNGRWGYRDLTMTPVDLTERHSTYPVDTQTTVYQYGTDYIELTGRGDVTIDFTGSTRVNVVNNQAHSGQYQWYSHRGDDSNTRLTRAFDLSEVSRATLNYWVWYDIESDWDYGYVEVSTDDGNTWTILKTPHSATTNPSGNAYGPGYTGASGGGPTWLEESIDLSMYAGIPVLIRFEYVTDDAVNRPGLTIDDISIPEIGFFDDVESGTNGWQAEGFVRIDNILPQRFKVQLLEIGDEITLRSLPLDETNHGTLTVAGLDDDIERAVLIVSGLTPITTEPANYQYRLSQ